jgi:hypothetical protein
VEIGLGVVLLAAAGLLIRSFANVLDNESGFDASKASPGWYSFKGIRRKRR